MGGCFGSSTRGLHRERRRPRRRSPLRLEALEARALLATVTVHVFDFDFSVNPQGQPIVDPTIHVGDTVHWVWDAGAPHSTTSVAGSKESWDSGVHTAPFSFDHTFTQSGVFTYDCSIHGRDLGNGKASGMFGTVTVLAASSSSPVTLTHVTEVLNKKHQVTQIIVDFSGAVNTGEASNVVTYRLVTAGKKGSFTAKNARVIRLISAALNSVGNEVTLTPSKPFKVKKPVQLRINGQAPAGLQDSLGQFIDGNHDGQPGGDAVAVLSRQGVSIS
jgi:plastocyanin